MSVEKYTDDDGNRHTEIHGSHTDVDICKDEDGHTTVTVTHDYDDDD